jgi:calcium channel MID1
MDILRYIMISPYRSKWQERSTVFVILLLATLLPRVCVATIFEDMVYRAMDMDGVVIDSLLDGRHPHLVERQSNVSVLLADNSVVGMDINPASTDFWTFPFNSSNPGNGTVYITVSTCTQPFPNVQLNATEVYANGTPPALQLYVSTDPSNTRPGPGQDDSRQTTQTFTNGFVNITLNSVTSDVYITVLSHNISADWQGSWSYQLGTSTQGLHALAQLTTEPQQSVIAGENLWVIDTSQADALITTGNLSTSTQQPFDIYAVPADSDHVFSTLSNSFCAFRSNPSLLTTANANISMTTRGAGGLPKQQFFLQGLSPNSTYNVYLTLPLTNNSLGGTVFTPSMSIQTKVSNNCQLVFNLPFCTETAYAAPANPNILNSSALSSFYDNLASSLYTNFSTTLQLTPCNTTLTAQYSLFRNCSTCATAYKNWLCAVTIPRCADITNLAPYLFDRPVNTSRQSLIDQTVKPGAYKEFMPCSDLCWGIEQNCPSTLGFGCPLPGSFAMQNSYVEDSTGKTCNAPQLQYLASGVGRGKIVSYGVLGIMVLVHLAFWIA